MAIDRRTAILQAAVRAVARRGTRGLRVQELSREAGVSTALIYYHFGDRAGLLRETLEFVNERAGRYTEEAISESTDALRELELTLLLELQDRAEVVENSTAWGELRSSAVFERVLQEPLRASTATWNREIAAAIRRVQRDEAASPEIVPEDAAERLTALVEALSERWLSQSITLERARTLMADAIKRELASLA